MACAKQTEAIGLASILTIGEDAVPKGKKRSGVSVVSAGAGIQPYSPMKLPSSRDAHLMAMVVSLEAANAILPSSLYANPMLPLAATLAIFRATLDSPSVAP